jgi:pSer/pThr/pTyr-binding forkhead associated (FHA) protein
MKPRLIATSGPLKGQGFPLDETPLTVGQAPENLVVLDDELVSKCHFSAWLNAGRPYLRDGDTRNGTWVNGAVQIERCFESGDRIKCGSTLPGARRKCTWPPPLADLEHPFAISDY